MRDVHRAKCGDQKNGNGHPAARCPANEEGLDGVPCVRGGLVGPTGLLAAVKAGCRAISEKVGSQFLSLRQRRFRHRSPSFKLSNNSRPFFRVSYLYTFTHLCYNSGVERG